MKSNNEDHSLAKTIIVSEVTKMIANKYKVSLDKARDMFYQSKVSLILSNDETGLYGDSPLSVFSLFEQLNKQ